MNLKNVLRTYGLLRNLTNDESALLETLRGLSESDREQLVESLSPGKVAGKRTTKKPSSKSPRASAMAAVIKDSLKRGQEAKDKSSERSDDPNEHCQKQLNDSTICDEPADANVHHLRGATGYHEFVAGKLSARSVVEGSSASDEVQSSTANSEDGTESAGSAAHVASGGD